MIYQVWALLFLLICAIEDLVKQKIHIWICITNALTAIMVKMISGNMKWKEYGIALGVCVLIYAFILVTKEAVGKGDGLVFFSMVSILNLSCTVEILFWGLILCCIFSLPAIALGKMKLKSSIPLIPFVFAGNIVWMLMGGSHG